MLADILVAGHICAAMDEDHHRCAAACGRLVDIENLARVGSVGLVACDDNAILGSRLEQRLKRGDGRIEGGVVLLVERAELSQCRLQIWRQFFHLRIRRRRAQKTSEHGDDRWHKLLH